MPRTTASSRSTSPSPSPSPFTRRRRPARAGTVWLLALLAVVSGGVAAAADDPVLWPEHQRAFLQDGGALLWDEGERRAFLAENEEAREARLAAFLADPLPETEENELVLGIERRRALVASEYPSPLDARARIAFLHGLPNARQVVDCGAVVVPIELWRVAGAGDVTLVFYRPRGSLHYELWRPGLGKRVLYSSLMRGWFHELEDFGRGQTRLDIRNCQAVAAVDAATRTVGLVDEDPDPALGRAIDTLAAPPADLAAWARRAASTETPERPAELAVAPVEVDFPYRTGQRIATRFFVRVDPGVLAVEQQGEEEPRVRVEVEGLLEQSGNVFEEFKFRFDREPSDEEPVLLVFERRLRPGRNFLSRLVVRDPVSGAERRLIHPVAVPREVERVVEAASASPAEAVAATRLAGEDSLHLIPPVTDGLSKTWRTEAVVSGEAIRKVEFAVDEEVQLTRNRPPFTADLRLTDVPTEQVVTARGLDAAGELVAEDRILLNQARGAFAVKILSPTVGAPSGEAIARAEVSVPEGGRLESVEFLIDEQPVVALDRPPFEVPIEWQESDSVSYLTVVARLADGRREEDVFFLNTPENYAQVDVGLVELFATVSDGSGRLVDDLSSEDFRVTERGEERPIEQFDLVHNLPLVIGFALDSSTSMADHMATAREAAVGFLQSLMEPGDRAFAVAFSTAPRLVAAPTDDPRAVEAALLGVNSEGWTTLYDAVVKSLFYFRGFGGRRALILLSDGEDTSSATSFGEALRYARESGAVVYSVGLGASVGLGWRRKLERLAEETGGRFFRAAKAEDLSAVYADIEAELRSQYFLTFEPQRAAETSLDDVEVEVRGGGLKVRATRGYAP